MIDGYQALRAVCAAAGWEWCEEHKTHRDTRPGGCFHLHAQPEPEHAYFCEAEFGRDCICGGPR